MDNGTTAESLVHPDAPQGKRFFGMCDMRRAVIIMNIVGLVMSAMALLGELFNQYGTDARAVVVALVVGVLYGLALVGAVKYRPWFLIGIIVYSIVSIASLFGHAIYLWSVLGLRQPVVPFMLFGIVVTAAFLYAHVILFQEMRQGIMTPENYPKEKHSCCCV